MLTFQAISSLLGIAVLILGNKELTPLWPLERDCMLECILRTQSFSQRTSETGTVIESHCSEMILCFIAVELQQSVDSEPLVRASGRMKQWQPETRGTLAQDLRLMMTWHKTFEARRGIEFYPEELNCESVAPVAAKLI